MQAEHRETEARIFLAEGYDSLAGFQVDAWHTYRLYPSLSCSGNHSLKVLSEFLAVQMAMCINHD